jgi:hypothetical protein
MDECTRTRKCTRTSFLRVSTSTVRDTSEDRKGIFIASEDFDISESALNNDAKRCEQW